LEVFDVKNRSFCWKSSQEGQSPYYQTGWRKDWKKKTWIVSISIHGLFLKNLTIH